MKTLFKSLLLVCLVTLVESCSESFTKTSLDRAKLETLISSDINFTGYITQHASNIIAMRSLTAVEYDKFGQLLQTNSLLTPEGKTFTNSIGFYPNAVDNLKALTTHLDHKYDYSESDLSAIIKSASEQKAKELLPALQGKVSSGKQLMCPGPSEFQLATCDGMCSDQSKKQNLADRTAELNWYSGCMYGCTNRP